MENISLDDETLYEAVEEIEYNDTFKDLKFTLDNTEKLHTSQGIRISVKQAQILSATDTLVIGFLETLSPQYCFILYR